MIYYIQSKFPYYSQTFVKEEVEYFKKSYKVKVLTLYPLKFKYFSFIFTLNSKKLIILLKYLFLIFTKSSKLKEIIFYIYALIFGFYVEKMIKANSILRVHLPKYNGLSSLIVKKLKKVKFIPVFHSYDLFTHNIFLKEILKNAYYIETISQYNKNFLKKYTKNRIEVVHCGINFNNLPILEEKEDFIIFVGRLHRTKGLDEVLKILSNSPYKLIVIGGGNIGKYKKLSRKLNVNASFLGKQKHEKTLKLIGKSKLLILPSRINQRDGDRDGIPVVLMEALALKTVVITRRVSGIPELIIHKKTGYLYGDLQEARYYIDHIFNQYPLNIVNNGYKLVQKKFNNRILFNIKRKLMEL